MEVSGQLYDPAALPPKEGANDTHWIGSWVSPEARLDAVVKKKNCPTPARTRTPDHAARIPALYR
jgi:hypothetical protein